MILLIDNYDSFVHNLARYVRELGGEAVVYRNDAVTLDGIAELAPSHIILSPGPCSPTEAGISIDLVRRFGPTIPILGVCLGHQCIGAAYGADIVRARRPVHGRTSPITHDGSGIFTGLPSPFRAARYHSLVIARASLPRIASGHRLVGRRRRNHGCRAPHAPGRSVCSSTRSRRRASTATRCSTGSCRAIARRPVALPTGADGVDGEESAHRAAEAQASPLLPWGPPGDDRNGGFVPPPVELVR